MGRTHDTATDYGVSLAIWDHTVLPATRHIVKTPHLNPSQTGWYSIYLPEGGWKAELTQVTCYIPRLFTRPQTVTHPSTNRAQCRLTTLIEANAPNTTLRR